MKLEKIFDHLKLEESIYKKFPSKEEEEEEEKPEDDTNQKEEKNNQTIKKRAKEFLGWNLQKPPKASAVKELGMDNHAFITGLSFFQMFNSLFMYFSNIANRY